jgi:predicted alpha/beta hydrolase family esterase
MKNKTQIFYIHGGETFKSRKDYLNFLSNMEVSLEEKKKWSGEFLNKKLGDKFEIIRPRMPLSLNAKYEDWKIYFERYFPLFKNNIILIGNSLGGIFLAKYLSENKFPEKILSLYLVCSPYDDSLPGEDLAGGFKLPADLSRLDKCSQNINLLFSQDDEVVPLSHAEKYRKKLKKANVLIFEGKNGHFQVSKFPELVEMIKADLKNIK